MGQCDPLVRMSLELILLRIIREIEDVNLKIVP